MGKKLTLPLLASPVDVGDVAAGSAAKPTIDAARRRLGGAVTASAPPVGLGPGRIVSVARTSGGRRPAVVIYAASDEVHVLLDPVRLRRVSPGELLAYDADVDDELAKLAADARLFAMLVEGQDVRYADDSGSLVEAKLIEKCRWGALVGRPDGAVVAVGFRKLWPAPAGFGVGGPA